MKFEVISGDCRVVLKSILDSSIDSVVTDPPSGIRMMGRKWDHFKPDTEDERVAERAELMAFQNFLVEVFVEVYRVLKPGAFGLVWALPRTSHHTGMALERSGFEIRDRLSHVFSQGYKKGLDIRKTLLEEGFPEEAEKWVGHHTGIKPAMEDWWLIRKPISGRVIDNLLKFGTGSLDIDSSRIYTDWNEEDRPDSWKKSGHTSKPGAAKVAAPPGQGIECHPLGRWPANFVLSHSLGCQRVGFKTLKGDQRGNQGGKRPGGFFNTGSGSGDGKPNAHVYGNENLPIYECIPGCPIQVLESQQAGSSRFFKTFEPDYEDPFLYQAKPSTKEKNSDLIGELLVNEHITVKSLKLMRYLVKLVTPPGGKVLDPFAGSGTTLVAALEEGFDCSGIENDPESIPVLQNRVGNAYKREEERLEQEAAFNLIFELESE
jgi:site-specific DNA-methyltransferase (adenine-specific)